MSNLFPRGLLCVNANVVDETPLEFWQSALNRHAQGDWGDLCASDKKANQVALDTGDRLVSRYNGSDGDEDVSIYIITEWNRSRTTVFFCSDY